LNLNGLDFEHSSCQKAEGRDSGGLAVHQHDRGYPPGIDPTPFATGPMQPPDPTERGFKDTTKANPATSPPSGRGLTSPTT
jgi:hypothetical protein